MPALDTPSPNLASDAIQLAVKLGVNWLHRTFGGPSFTSNEAQMHAIWQSLGSPTGIYQAGQISQGVHFALPTNLLVTPGFAPAGGGAEAVTTTLPPPPELSGSESLPQLPGPISDTAAPITGASIMPNLAQDVAGLFTFLGGGSPQQILSAVGAGAPTTPAATPAPSPSPTLNAAVAAAGNQVTVDTVKHRGQYYKAVYDAAGNITGYKPVKRRKRRRKLLTASDAAGLMELKTIFGGMRGGTSMIDSWILGRGRG